MADIYFKRTKTLAGEYWNLLGVKNVAPQERSGLTLVLQEYQVMAGDIGEPEQAALGMAKLRDELKADGHILHMQESVAESVVESLLNDEERAKAHEEARKALEAGDENSMLAFRKTMPHATQAQANAQRERIRTEVEGRERLRRLRARHGKLPDGSPDPSAY